MSLLGRRDWIKVQGRANAALLLVARAMDAEFVAPAGERDYGALLGRTHGCSYELRVANPRRESTPALMLTIRHFHNQATWNLEGPGLQLPALDPAAVQSAIERACHGFATQD